MRSSLRHNCCISGKAIEDPSFPKLNPLPDGMAKVLLERTAHMTKTSQMYNNMFSTGKEKGYFVCLFLLSNAWLAVVFDWMTVKYCSVNRC